ncbi:hypothetical protein [Grimontia hollisae]|uniref:hypothetical protein n=1 Tax=Grimontia hollisae TaxID=673 RepID=UPI001E5DEED2|nr:hypothetical protein [Grimontia hollisae]
MNPMTRPVSAPRASSNGADTAQQLDHLYTQFELALNAGDWAALGALDIQLSEALHRFKQQPLNADTKVALTRLNAFYTTMISEGRKEQARIRLQLSQQEATKQGVMAYLGHHE